MKWSAPDHDAEEVEKYAREHPDEDEEGKDAQIGGASGVEAERQKYQM